MTFFYILGFLYISTNSLNFGYLADQELSAVQINLLPTTGRIAHQSWLRAARSFLFADFASH
jgi:hypothetical protein